MQGEGYLKALAGLLYDPKFASEIARIVPKHWLEFVSRARESESVIKAAQRAAGLRDEKATISRPGKMLSVFCSLMADGLRTPEPAYWPQGELKIEGISPFPTSGKDGDDMGKNWGNFLKEAETLRDVYDDGDEKAEPFFIENLMLLMQRYLWSTPCAYPSLPDTSLYDHARMTAALSALKLEDVILVGGDISGLQDFIYTISADGAASALRGRSFYLQLLNEILPRLVLHDLGLPHTNLIYAGGGNFYLLANSDDETKLEELRGKISRILLAHHRGELYLALASIPLKDDDFFGGEISKRWKDLGGKLQHAKQRRFSELGNELKEMFKPQGHGGNEELQCRVCGLEHEKIIPPKEEGDVRKCEPCDKFEKLGQKLRKADYLFIKQIGGLKIPSKNSAPGIWHEILADFGFEADVSEKDPPTVDHATIFALKDGAVNQLKARKDLAVGRRYFVNVTPSITEEEISQLEEKRKPQDKKKEKLDVRNVKPFDVLQEQANGVKRLGILRMDVDNLGRLFSDGIEKPCLARIASLSFAISLYFEGWVEQLAEARNKTDGIDRLYSIYSGGDDLFFVGSWDAVAELAREIRRDLSTYAANHPGIHASAGIVLIGGKYPLYQAARDAGKAEENAKTYRSNKDKAKNAITFLGQTVPWELFGTDDCENEGPSNVHALMHQLVNMLAEEKDKPKPPRALLGILINLQEKFAKAANDRLLAGRDKNKAGEKQILFGPWQWLGFYYLTRMIRREQGRNADFAKKVEQLNEQLKTNQFGNIEWIGLSARWAELLIRKSE